MRKVVSGLFHSLDGAVEGPDQWQFDSFDAELGELMTRTIGSIDETVLGRVTYQEWADYWPNSVPSEDNPFAEFINQVPKHVASTTLTGPLEWQNSRLIEDDLHDHVRQLKESSGQDIGVQGSISIVRDLFLAGLLDELILITHPVIAGGSFRRLFQPGDPTTRLELVDLVKTSAGNAVLTYRRRAD
ncbi:dihydrofolate reductase family protein [Ornithinimicrobium faecis]|uniref:Dihydrofolate reductase family protein n=1 Tax=Ornithinimicrobium faecis TaxID=2934158 RepID=A0ABY4YVE9_9MICO|nr:dihydrofolate reductase family protein [Ornithinimicrobium sp. HY1793]USQ80616.1 dihydrofolate reductase family protein [Ornithinimicrobium sp. HY1793]